MIHPYPCVYVRVKERGQKKEEAEQIVLAAHLHRLHFEFWRILMHRSLLWHIKDKQEVTDLIKMPCCWVSVAQSSL